MSNKSSPLVHWSQYLAARSAAALLTGFEVELNLRSAAAFGRVLHYFDCRHRERTLQHLCLAFPERSDSELETLARQTFEHFVQLVVEVFHTPRLIHADSWHRRLHLNNLSEAIRLFNSGRPSIMVTGHLGNWEVLGYLLAVLGLRMEAVARPLDNPLISRWLFGIRERRGLRIITKWGAVDRMADVLDSGGTLGFIADQNAGDKGLFVPFFGKLASTYKSIGLLAIDRDIPIVCGYARRLPDRFEYELGVADIIYPADWKSRPDPLYYVTARYMWAIERMIRDCPQQYLWMHRRWKSRPRYEREGKTMPAGLRKNLEALPWINPETLQRLLRPSS